jgi:formylglycine-generating enzyme required for sulfatase activity
MNADLTRKLAALQARSHLLSTQGGLLSDLGDIKECRRLRDEVAAAVQESAAKGLTPPDPLEVVLADWRRLVAWSDGVQGRLKLVDEICRGGRHLNESQAVTLDWLERWRKRLETAPRELGLGLDNSRKAILSGDWQQGQVHPETLEVGTVMAPTFKPECASGEVPAAAVPLPPLLDPPVLVECAPGEERGRAEPEPAAILASSWRAVQPGSPEVAARLQRIRDAKAKAESALADYPRHQAVLAEVQQLLTAGELTAAETKLKGLKPRFSELDYAGWDKLIRERRERLKKASDEVGEAERAVGDTKAIRVPRETLGQLERLAYDLNKKGVEAGGEEGRLWAEVAKGAESVRQRKEQLILEEKRKERGQVLLWLRVLLVVALVIGVTVLLKKAEQKTREEARAAEVNAKVALVAKIALGEAEAKALAEAEARAEAERAAAQRAREEAAARAEAERAAAQRAREEAAVAEARAESEREAARAEEERLATARAKAEAERVALSKAKTEMEQRFKVAKVWTAGADGLELMAIRGGIVVMYLPSATGGREVIVGDFFLGKTEITQVQWGALMADSLERMPPYHKGDDLPMDKVTWEQASEYCLRLTAQEERLGRIPAGWHYRLPTAAEWSYAFLSQVQVSASNDLENLGWYEGNSKGRPHPVALKKSNDWGIYDMIGNVWEWCLDEDTSKENRFETYRIIIGGSWADEPWLYKSFNGAPITSLPQRDYLVRFKYGRLGFRIALCPVGQ